MLASDAADETTKQLASARVQSRGCDVVAHDSVEDEVASSPRPCLRSLTLAHAAV